jgi:hypothetical protein
VPGTKCKSPRTALYVSWYRCVWDGLAHAVTDEEFLRGVRLRQGRYRSLCGHEVLIHSCLVPADRSCPRCWGLVIVSARVAARRR